QSYQYLKLLDHASIFVLIAATASAFIAVSTPPAALRTALSGLIWAMASAGVGLKLLYSAMTRALSTTLYLMMGWVAGCSWIASSVLGATPSGVASAALPPLALAGLLHTAGALVYVRRLPDWWPGFFGYHELFHTLVVLGNAALTM